MDEEDKEVPREKWEKFVSRVDNVMKGYFNKPEDTAQTLHGRWLHTGDMAYKDEDGYLFIVDRKKEMIIRGGENISPIKVGGHHLSDILMLRRSQLLCCHVIYGEEVMACLVLHPDRGIDKGSISRLVPRTTWRPIKCRNTLTFGHPSPGTFWESSSRRNFVICLRKRGA